MNKYKVITGFVLPDGSNAKPDSTVELDGKFADLLLFRQKIESVDESQAGEKSPASKKTKKSKK